VAQGVAPDRAADNPDTIFTKACRNSRRAFFVEAGVGF